MISRDDYQKKMWLLWHDIGNRIVELEITDYTLLHYYLSRNFTISRETVGIWMSTWPKKVTNELFHQAKIHDAMILANLVWERIKDDQK